MLDPIYIHTIIVDYKGERGRKKREGDREKGEKKRWEEQREGRGSQSI